MVGLKAPGTNMLTGTRSTALGQFGRAAEPYDHDGAKGVVITGGSKGFG